MVFCRSLDLGSHAIPSLRKIVWQPKQGPRGKISHYLQTIILSSILNEFRVKTELYGKYFFPHRRILNLNWTLAFCTPFSLLSLPAKFYWCTPVGFRVNILCVPCHNNKESLNTQGSLVLLILESLNDFCSTIALCMRLFSNVHFTPSSSGPQEGQVLYWGFTVHCIPLDDSFIYTSGSPQSSRLPIRGAGSRSR